ncbi:MAG: hypothetical protein ABSA78_10465 [Candidatus Sulfotelmatobacter sp.]|jgi:hypothetical protein
MKEVAILLLLVLMLSSCNSQTAAQSGAGGVWQAQMLGGVGVASGFSFNTQFTVNGDGSLSISNFQFLTSGQCFPLTESPVGSMMLTEQNNNTVTGTFAFTIAANGNTLVLSGTVTGTESGTNTQLLPGTTIFGTWTLTGTGSCANAGGSFTMAQAPA